MKGLRGGMTVGMGLSGLVLVAGCEGSSQVHTLNLEVTDSSGETQKFNIRGETSWEIDSLGKPFASWPDVAEWGVDTEAGLLIYLAPYQPGSYDLLYGGTLILDGQEEQIGQLAATVHMEKVEWTGSPAFPFRQTGSVEGTTVNGTTIKGSFTTSSDNCTDTVVNDSGCGLDFPNAEYLEQVWTGSWEYQGECPQALIDRFLDGNQLTLNGREAYVGSGQPLECVVTYPNSYKVLCGFSDTKYEVEGCNWSVTAVGWPGNTYAGYTPAFSVFAGTVDEGCAPKLCWLYAATMTHISGAGL